MRATAQNNEGLRGTGRFHRAVPIDRFLLSAHADRFLLSAHAKLVHNSESIYKEFSFSCAACSKSYVYVRQFATP